jgi:uncharacterized protein YndB with AHSA1/START domain
MSEATPSHAVLVERDGRPALRFERRLRQPPERVWRALTERAELSAWHPTPFEFEPRPGGRVRYTPPSGLEAWPDGEVLACEPPQLLSYTWGGDELHWELAADHDGCLLRLTHVFDDRLKAARDAAGWHLCLDSLEDALAQRTPRSEHDEAGLPAGWRELNGDYQRRFGIDSAAATPPPRS